MVANDHGAPTNYWKTHEGFESRSSNILARAGYVSPYSSIKISRVELKEALATRRKERSHEEVQDLGKL